MVQLEVVGVLMDVADVMLPATEDDLPGSLSLLEVEKLVVAELGNALLGVVAQGDQFSQLSHA